ncbi:unnamed protein product [Parajaminaea phylloscopi]
MATPRQASSQLGRSGGRGDSLARRSALALQSVFGWPKVDEDEREPLLNNGNGEASTSYGATSGDNRRFAVPRPPKVKGPVRVEAKVWLANERTWISWLHVSILIGSFALALFNSADFFSHHHPDLPEDPTKPKHPKRNHALEPGTIRTFGMVYAGIAVLTLAWGLGNYLRRVHLIKTKYSGSFDDLIGPPLICTALFFAVLLNFIARVQQYNLDVPSGP